MHEPDKLRCDKLELAIKILFELPPSETLPVFKRLSLDSLETLLDQLKEEASRRGGPSTRDSSTESPAKKTAQLSESVEHDLQTEECNQRVSIHVDVRRSSNEQNSQASNSLAGMKRFTLLTDEEIKAVLKHCDTSYWAPALKNAPIVIQQRIMSCMAPAAVGLLKVEIDKIGDVGAQQEKLAREKIVYATFRLATNGLIMQERRISDAA